MLLFVYVNVCLWSLHLITKPSDIFYLMQWQVYILSVHIEEEDTFLFTTGRIVCSRLCACSRSICLFHSHTYLFIPPSVRYLCVSFYPSSTNKRSRPSLKVSPHISSPQLRLDCNPTQTNTASCIHTVESVCFTGNTAKNGDPLVFIHNCLCHQQCSSPNEKRAKNYLFINHSKLRKVC